MKSKFVKTPALRMHYLEQGEGSPVIAIHGWPETSREWVGVAGELADNWRVLAPDTRGHGDTEAPPDGYDRARLARDIVDFMDALDIERCPIVAHDWGGIIAVKLALDHGERVERLCLLDTICTGWPVFVQYYYWFMDGDRVERFFSTRARDFIASVVGGQDRGLPPPPGCPVEFQSPELTAPEPWATDEVLNAYTIPYEQGDATRVSCNYYRSMQFHRVMPDSGAPNGERYERVPHDEMGRMWHNGEVAAEYLDFAPEDRHKTYHGETLWLFGRYLVEVAGGSLNEAGIPVGDPSFDSFSRHFPNLSAEVVDGGHFFVESDPQGTARLIDSFLRGG
ncbi:MAG: alpha/beta hydrolase [Gammaproteobacteria bacterium]|nr:alpha/beta hydrolase [Rhodospirillaceae bacterium]MDE0364118.1 alpha/beta hydrolase [Gammaproteobacteria bacterium]